MKFLLRALKEDGSDILGTEFNFVKEAKSFGSLLTTNVWKIARQNVDQGLVHSYRVEEFSYADNPTVFTLIK